MTRPISGGSRERAKDDPFDASPFGSAASAPRGAGDFDGVTHPGASRKGFLEIRLNGGAPERFALNETHIVIGRVPGVQIFLDHHTVSRRHAEMFCDPFGRFWIRDLGSTNGTVVNEEPVIEQVLSPGDRIGVGDYVITFSLDGGEAARGAGRSPPVEYEKPTAIHTLLDFEPPRIAAEHLRTLLELSRRLIAVESPEDRIAELCQLAVRSDFHAMTAVVLRLDATSATRISQTYHPGHHVSGAPDAPPIVGDDAPYVSRGVLSAVRETREPVIAGNVQSQVSEVRSIELTIAREVMELWVIACPLRITTDEVDVLYVTLPPSYGGAEWLSLFALAAEVYQQSEAAWAARRHEQDHVAIERELGTARQIQRALLPKRLDFLGLDVAVGFEPCKWVGGDHVDVMQMPDGRVLSFVADVCGKGLQAALVTSSLHTMVRATVDTAPSLAALMERVNRHLCEWLPSHSFVTMVAAVIDPSTGEIECVNAGHPPVLIVDRDGDLRFLQSAENPALGVAPFQMEAQRALLEFGDVLLMYTDGLTELRDVNKEMLGQDRLAERFARIAAANPGERSAFMAEKLRKILEDFRGGELPEDDQAFVLAQRSA